MADNITNKDYITITDTKVMVGGEETTKYRGENILNVKSLPSYLKDIQNIVKWEYGIAPTEMHVLSSKTTGNYARSGTPSATHGPNAWVRFMLANGRQTPWVFRYSSSSASICAGYCGTDCGNTVRNASDFRSGVFRSVADAIKPVVQVKPKVVNRSGDVTTMEIDLDNKKLQFQINARSLLKSNGK